jgi:hypothetical protein
MFSLEILIVIQIATAAPCNLDFNPDSQLPIRGFYEDSWRTGLKSIKQPSTKQLRFHLHAEAHAADRAARYAARANRASAPPQQHHLTRGIALGN